MNNDLTNNLSTLTDRITDSLKPKFKVGQRVVCIMSKENVTKDNVYVVEESYVCANNIPCVTVIGDNCELFEYYQTYFKAADTSKFDVKMSVEGAKDYLFEHLDVCLYQGEKFVNHFFLTKLKTDKELQKALLVLIQSASCLGEGK